MKRIIFALIPAVSIAGTVGGSVSGLNTSGLVVTLNTTTFRVLASNATSFQFNTTVAQGAPYAVAVGIQPSTQSCSVANGIGVMGSTNVTNIAISCVNMAQVLLSWTKPTLNTDGSTLTDIAGYVVYYGTSPLALSTSRLISGGDTLTATINLPAGKKYYFAVATRSLSGGIGAKSNQASKQL